MVSDCCKPCITVSREQAPIPGEPDRTNPGDYKGQAKAGLGFEAASFAIDWPAQKARCLQGKISSSWTPASDRQHNEVIKIKFSLKDCQGCVSRELGTKSAKARRRITVRPQEQYLALEGRRAEEHTEDFKKKYAKQAGGDTT